MARLLAIAVFIVMQGTGLVVGLQCQATVFDWMTGGHWLSPAVRIPLVATGVVFAEILLLCACAPCHRFVAGLCGCHPDESANHGMAAPAR
jgi:hypothetical protein